MRIFNASSQIIYMPEKGNQSFEIHIRGLVQGVGFRPFIYRLARQMQLDGWVENSNRGVLVGIKSSQQQAQHFAGMIESEAPKAASIHSIELTDSGEAMEPGFIIRESSNVSDEITGISPDIAVCEDCLKDLKQQKHRLNYPLINCTHCGPRFSIIHDLPYDRHQTTMAGFDMCDDCRKEYEDVADRRFHAQPLACNQCGPHYTMNTGQKSIEDFQVLLRESVVLVEQGELLAVKGQGGYFLLCDAENQQAVDRLRALKGREGKPFAVMFRDLESARECLHINAEEEILLKSWRRPIVLLKKKKDLAPGVSNKLDTMGAMLPYMPFHYQFFEQSKLAAVVLTSANFSEEPILINDQKTSEKLSGKVACIISYNRAIHNRTDDSVTAVFGKHPVILRRSRGWVPSPVRLGFDVEGIFAAGAELVNSFCLGRGKQAILSQYIGDLKNMATLDFYQESISRFERMFRMKTSLFVSDLHPDYLSTKYAKARADDLDIPFLSVQHHHAHIASNMAEHGLDEPVIGISFDGIGLGDDGRLWGGEILYCDLQEYERISHFEYVPMPGGDKASKEPWRMALSYLYHTFGEEALSLRIPAWEKTKKSDRRLLVQAMQKDINSPLTSSAGRLFDAVAAITGICTHASFHAEAPMRLEAAIDHREKVRYEVAPGPVISWKPVMRSIIQDLDSGTAARNISARFHNTVVEIILQSSQKISRERGAKKVLLSGGTFQNRYLCEQLLSKGRPLGLDFILQKDVPMNDQGIALGQLAIAAKRRSLGLI